MFTFPTPPVDRPVQAEISNSEEEKLSCTVVIGRLEAETAKKIIVDYMDANIVQSTPGIEEKYAYSIQRIGFLRFVSKDDMWNFIKQWQSKEKPKVNGRPSGYPHQRAQQSA